jgi:hypothetical protein
MTCDEPGCTGVHCTAYSCPKYDGTEYEVCPRTRRRHRERDRRHTLRVYRRNADIRDQLALARINRQLERRRSGGAQVQEQ